MDNNVKETLNMLETMRDFFSGVSDMVSRSDPDLYEKLGKAITRSTRSITELGIKDEKESPVTTAFKSIHLMESARRGLAIAFNILNDIKFSHHGSDLSKTRAVQLSSTWRAIAKMYSGYLRKMHIDTSQYVSQLQGAKPEELSSLLHKYPHAYMLYADLMTAYMESPDSDRTAAMLAVENDMSHALGERKWISPFLSFGLLATGNRGTVQELTGIKSPASTDHRSISALAMELKTRGVGLVAIWRDQPQNAQMHVQNGVDNKKGIQTVTNVMTKTDADEWNWDIHTWNNDEKYVLVLEFSGGLARIMRPWPAPSVPPTPVSTGVATNALPTVPRSRVSKIYDRQFGRPDAYFRMRDRLHKAYDTRIQAIGKKQPAGAEHKFNHTLVVAKMTEAFNKLGGGISERIGDNSVWKAFQNAMFEQAASPQLSTLVYMINTLEKMFRQDFEKQYMRDCMGGAAVIDNPNLWFADKCGELFDQLMLRNDSIFGFLRLKSQMMDEINAHRGLKKE